MRYKKKKGSTLLVVVCLCAFLSVLTLSIMLVTTGGFKLRKDENTRIENFYSADSGIEIAKNEIVKVIEEAVEEGREVIEKIMGNPKDYPTIDISIVGWEQRPFKNAFENYIDENLEIRIDNTKIENEKPIKTKIYDKFRRDDLVVKVDAVKGEKYQNGEILETQKPDYSINSTRHQAWEITSNFKDKDNKDREVKVNYNIKTPNYGKKAGKAVPNSNIFDYIMAMDGNLDINNNGSFDSLGDMWIGGENQSGNRNLDLVSYKPAIKLYANAGTQGANFNWQGKITTPRDLFIDDVKLTANSLYANNFLYKGVGDALVFKNDILVRNDFIFDAEKSTLTVENYYGLDDIDEKQVQTDKEMETDYRNWDTSSSIIVNSKDFGTGSKITINKDAYVLGTAYLQLDGKDYKTGESIVINKFTEPYTNRRNVEENLNEKKYLYKYLSPLHIIDKKWNGSDYVNLTIEEKAKIVADYVNKMTPKSTIFNGLSIGKESYSSGILYDDGIVKNINGNYPEYDEKKNIVEYKIKEFSQEAYNMGGKLSYEEAKDNFKNRGNQSNIVDGSFDWKFIRDNMMRQQNLKKEDGSTIFKRAYSYPTDENSPKDIAIFESSNGEKRLTVREIVGEKNLEINKPETLYNNYFLNYTVTIILNSSERDDNNKPINPKELNFKKGLTHIEKGRNNKFNIPLDYIKNTPNNQNITIVISDGDINIIQPTGEEAWEVRGVFYSSSNLDLNIGTGMRFGNFGVPSFVDMNNVFKKLFGGVLNGVLQGGIIDQGSGDHVIYPPDLLEQKEWNLIK